MASSEKRLVRAMCMILFAGTALLALVLVGSPVSDAETQTDNSVNVQVSITIDTNFPGLLVGYDSSPLAPAPVTFQTDIGSVHMIVTKSPQPDSPVDTRYRFDRWRGGPMTWGWNITASANVTYFADFVRQYLIMLRSNIPGPELNTDMGDCTPPPPSQGPISCWADEGSSPTLVINTPQVYGGCRYEFLQWSDGDPNPIRMIGPVNGPATYLSMWSTECSLTMDMDASCQGTVMPGSSWYPPGTNVPIGWTPPTGLPPGERYRFKMWLGSGNGNYTGPNPSSSVTINGAIHETAYCYHEFNVVFDTNPTGLAYEVDGIVFASQRSFWWENLSTHFFKVTATTQGMGLTRYVFLQWSDGVVNPNHPPYVVLGSASYVADFSTQHKIVLNQVPVTPAGIGGLQCVGVPDCWYNENDPATVTVTSPWPSGAQYIRYVFSHWTSDASGTLTSYTFSSMNAPKTVTANWAIWYEATVTSMHGAPTCAPNADCWFLAGTSALISVSSPVPGGTGTRYAFVAWIGDATGTSNPVTVLMDAPKNITTVWMSQHLLTIDSSCGTTTDCGSPTGSGWYDEGITATISVTTPFIDMSSNTWDFTGWSGDASGTATSIGVLMDAPKSVTASWSLLVMYRLTVVTPYGTATCYPMVDCMFPPGSMATVTLSTLEVSGGTGTRFLFSTWTGDATNSSHPLILEMDGPKTVTAVWNTQHLLTIISTCDGENDCGSPIGAGWYNEGSHVTISVNMTHTDHSGTIWDFHNWTGAVHSDTNSTVVVMNGPETAIVTWTERQVLPTHGIEFWVWLLLVAVIVAVILVLILWMIKRKRTKKDEHGNQS